MGSELSMVPGFEANSTALLTRNLLKKKKICNPEKICIPRLERSLYICIETRTYIWTRAFRHVYACTRIKRKRT